MGLYDWLFNNMDTPVRGEVTQSAANSASLTIFITNFIRLFITLSLEGYLEPYVPYINCINVYTFIYVYVLASPIETAGQELDISLYQDKASSSFLGWSIQKKLKSINHRLRWLRLIKKLVSLISQNIIPDFIGGTKYR